MESKGKKREREDVRSHICYKNHKKPVNIDVQKEINIFILVTSNSFRWALKNSINLLKLNLKKF